MYQLWITLNYIPGSWSSKIQCGPWKSFKIGRIFCTNLEKFNEAFFHHCRDNLAPASGFQSLQFRLIENKLGINKVWIENIPHVIIFKRQNQQHILFCKIVMAFVLFSLQSQRTRYNRQDYRSAGTKFDIWSSKVSKPPWKKTLRNHSRISLRSTFFDSPSSPHDIFVSLPVVFLAVVVLFGNFAMMSLRFLLFSVIYVSSKAFKSCERQSLDHSESTASLLELVQVCLWCLQAAKYPI